MNSLYHVEEAYLYSHFVEFFNIINSYLILSYAFPATAEIIIWLKYSYSVNCTDSYFLLLSQFCIPETNPSYL